MRSGSGASRQRGALLIEVLVAIILCAFALLGFAALQARAGSAEFEAVQRSQALLMVEDMASRINNNRANAGAYVAAGLIGAGGVEVCNNGMNVRDRDLCEWGNLLRGTTEIRAGSRIGSMTNARGCITQAAGSSDRYVIAVAWQGAVDSGAPASNCGQGDAAFPSEARRRVVTSTVCIAALRDAASAPALPRC
jgi:type IV pilus assembly protein PilV